MENQEPLVPMGKPVKVRLYTEKQVNKIREQYENEIRDKDKIIKEMYTKTTIDTQPHCCEFHLSMDGVCFICGNHASDL